MPSAQFLAVALGVPYGGYPSTIIWAKQSKQYVEHLRLVPEGGYRKILLEILPCLVCRCLVKCAWRLVWQLLVVISINWRGAGELRTVFRCEGTNLVKIMFSDSLSVRKTNELKNTTYCPQICDNWSGFWIKDWQSQPYVCYSCICCCRSTTEVTCTCPFRKFFDALNVFGHAFLKDGPHLQA